MLNFIKNWTLPLAMLAGALGYFAYISIPAFNDTHAVALKVVAVVQPLLLFIMLFITFCKVKPQDLRFTRWQWWLLALQTTGFLLAALVLQLLPPGNHWRIVAEGAMLCLICPTATAASVITRRLGGDPGSLMAYTIIINLAVALLVPAVVPWVHPQPDLTFFYSFLSISSKVFPLLLGPFFLSVLLRWLLPETTERLGNNHNLPFYLWSVSLALAIAMSTRSIVHTHCPWQYQLGIAVVSLLTCILQFAFGRKMGKHYGEPISAAQACGQKNTVLIIWMGYTFMTPITSIAGGFYSIWHNLYNSWQLYRVKSEGL